MSFTQEDRTDVIALAVGVWGAAPGAANLEALGQQFENDATFTISDLAAELVTTHAYKEEYPDSLTSEQWATRVV
ncbi:MAG: hypothetical protein ACQETO_12440, partial [Pseudomonadota bacterium]